MLDAALVLATEGGLGAVSIGAIAERMGVTRPVVYSCFSDRVEVLTALLEREEEHLLTGVLAALASSGPADEPERLFVKGFQALLNTVAQRPASWRFIFETSPGIEVAERFARSRTVVANQFATLIGPSLKRWGTKDVARKTPVLVELFMSSGEGAVRALLNDSANWSPDELGEFVGRAVYRALRDA